MVIIIREKEDILLDFMGKFLINKNILFPDFLSYLFLSHSHCRCGETKIFSIIIKIPEIIKYLKRVGCTILCSYLFAK